MEVQPDLPVTPNTWRHGAPAVREGLGQRDTVTERAGQDSGWARSQFFPMLSGGSQALRGRYYSSVSFWDVSYVKCFSSSHIWARVVFDLLLYVKAGVNICRSRLAPMLSGLLLGLVCVLCYWRNRNANVTFITSESGWCTNVVSFTAIQLIITTKKTWNAAYRGLQEGGQTPDLSFKEFSANVWSLSM